MFFVLIQYCLFVFLFWSMFHMSQCDALYLSQPIFYSHSFLVYVLLVRQCLHHCFGGFVNVTSVIKNFQPVWLWKSARKNNMFFVCFLFCVSHSGGPTVLYASSVLGPNSRFGIRIRSIVFPCTFSIALTSIQSQLYSHVHSQPRADECIHVQSQLCWCAATIVNSCIHPPQVKKCTVKNLLDLESPPKNVISKCVFHWLKHGAASKPCVSSCSSASKKAQNWGFEITNVRYGHQPAFCRHFNDGSNSCFQTTNWNAAQAG